MKQRRLAKTVPNPCIVRDAALDILAEPLQGIVLHLIDQFHAFVTLREKD